MSETTTENKAPQEQTRSAIRSAARGASDTAQRGAATIEQANRSTAETMRRGSQASAEAVRHLSRAASETARRSGENYAGAQQEFMETASRQFEQTISGLTRALQDSAREWRTFMQLPTVAGDGLWELQRSLNGAAEQVFRTNLRASQELLRMISPATIAELQQRFMRDYLSALLEGSTGVFRAVRLTAEQTLEPLEERWHERREHGNGHGARVADVMERDVRIASPDDSVQQVARLMREEDTGILPVGDGERLIGMVTDRDVAVRLVAEGRDPAQTKVRDVMTNDVRYVYEDEDIDHVAENMANQQVRRLPVMNRQKRLVGVVSIGDIAKGPNSGAAAHALKGVSRDGGQHTQTAAE
ncbi:MAG: CBS domain-containing protein [Acetobacteraceae bacterium]|nr:CBS domain-containing protein [Acetobacteraceae bacterium]